MGTRFLSTAWLFLLVLHPHLVYTALVSFNTLPWIFLPELEPLPPLCSVLMLHLSSPFPLVFLVPNKQSFSPNHSIKGSYSECVSIASPAVSTTSSLHGGSWHLCALPSASFSSSVCLPSVLLGCFSPTCSWWSPVSLYTGFPCSVLMFVLPFLSHFSFMPSHLHASLCFPFSPHLGLSVTLSVFEFLLPLLMSVVK